MYSTYYMQNSACMFHGKCIIVQCMDCRQARSVAHHQIIFVGHAKALQAGISSAPRTMLRSAVKVAAKGRALVSS